MKKSKNNNIILGFGYWVFEFGFSWCKGKVICLLHNLFSIFVYWLSEKFHCLLKNYLLHNIWPNIHKINLHEKPNFGKTYSIIQRLFLTWHFQNFIQSTGWFTSHAQRQVVHIARIMHNSSYSLSHSMAGANLNKSKKVLTSTTTASKYIPKRPRICINWNPPFQTSLHKIFQNCFLLSKSCLTMFTFRGTFTK